MKQRVRIVVIVHSDDKTLLLERAANRLDQGSRYELLNGKLRFGEQPEDSVARLVHAYLGVSAKHLELKDVITMVDPKSGSVNDLYVVFSASLVNTDISLDKEWYKSFVWVHTDDLSTMQTSDTTSYILKVVAGDDVESATSLSTVSDSSDPDFATVYTDGGSRGNPGLSAAGYYILAPDNTVLAKGGEFIGITNSRQAEYLALKVGLQKALELGLKKIHFKLDNLMIVGHMNGLYRIKNRELWPIYDEIKSLLKKLDNYTFAHIMRAQNIEADGEVNRVLDEQHAKTTIT